MYCKLIIPFVVQTRRFTLDCTFQQNYCNWRQDTRDKFDWKTTAGRTPSADTGPQSDPSGNVNGNFLAHYHCLCVVRMGLEGSFKRTRPFIVSFYAGGGVT